jgi:hypothetical protein
VEALYEPLYGPSSSGRRKRRPRTLCVGDICGGLVEKGGLGQRDVVTHGGWANGMPRNLFKPLDVVPINVPLSSMTVVVRIVGIAKTAEIPAQKLRRHAWRKPMPADENSGCNLVQTRRESAGKHPDDEHSPLSRL